MNPYCSNYYKPDALTKTYEIPMVPIPDKADWSNPNNLVVEHKLLWTMWTRRTQQKKLYFLPKREVN